MDIAGPNCTTWHDVLIRKGIDPSVSKSLIGFVSWNKGSEPSKLGEDITRALSGYKGSIYAMDTISSKYNDRGLLLVSSEISRETANRMFDIIMDFEQQEVYKM